MGTGDKEIVPPMEVTDDLRFGRYNFHRPHTIDTVVGRIASAEASKVIILSGPEGKTSGVGVGCN